ncbi:glycosyltransferase family 4 protein [Pedobacter sp. MR2016-19]|uniref:glycosyltransferase family 4 protein n=1 Tax=Pedobacter sp. MR2016-19 TaxID=2780089 RepID=UPI001875308D|nr:glycosyltransferase family 4 protein [Pedobacter sp. MR2016-19]MBE5321968.1 glycosyltransferase family 4 protein [Pedobacter sp. MR2016-19]
MKVVYTAPNKSHHYIYALGLLKANILYRFVSGFSRFSPRAKQAELAPKIRRADILQTIYIACLKFKLPDFLCRKIAYLAKIEQDLACKKYVKDCDIFLFYNGSGLSSCAYAKKNGVITIVEAVNSHISFQEDILKKEYEKLGLVWKPSYQKEKERRIKEYQEADFILMPSEFVRSSFIQMGFAKEKLLKIPYGFNKFQASNHQVAKDNTKFTVLFVGSISVRKGLRYLISAFNELKHPNKQLVIVGPTNHDTGIADLSLSSDIVFRGVLKGNDLEDAYHNADVFCLPSIEEGLALVLGEAIASGLPIIATTNTGASDIISDGYEGFIVPICDDKAILSKMQLLADNEALLTSMKQAAKFKSKDLPGWDVTTSNLVNTLTTIFNEKKNSR